MTFYKYREKMNCFQQIFCLFFAVFWGIVGNVQPRWKAFHWPFVRKNNRAKCRLYLSMLFLNFIPIAYFAIALACLSKNCDSNVSPIHIILFAIFPAFAGFSFYRLWLGFVECKPNLYYPLHKSGLFHTTEDQIDRDDPETRLYLSSSMSRGNIIAGLGYLVFGCTFLFLYCLIMA